jgi:hypothetical protein
MDIRQIRKSKGISLTQLSLSVGISVQNLSRYELGKRCWPSGLLQKVQACLGIEVTSVAPETLSWSAHRLLGQWSRWQTHVDPGVTWADCPPGYAQAYRRLSPKHTPRGEGLGLHLKAGLWFPRKWILWPQVSVAVQGKIFRPDALVMAWRGASQDWGFVEIDGAHHREDDWQGQRSQALKLPTVRWSQEQIENLQVAGEFKHFLGLAG